MVLVTSMRKIVNLSNVDTLKLQYIDHAIHSFLQCTKYVQNVYILQSKHAKAFAW